MKLPKIAKNGIVGAFFAACGRGFSLVRVSFPGLINVMKKAWECGSQA